MEKQPKPEVPQWKNLQDSMGNFLGRVIHMTQRSDEGSAPVNSQALASHLLGSSTIFGNRYLFVQHRSSQTLPSIWNTYHYSHFTDEEKSSKG